MKLEEIREFECDLDSFLKKEVSFRDFSIDGRLIPIPPLTLTKHERANGMVKFYFDNLDEPVEFSSDGRTDSQLLYYAFCLAYTYSRLNSFN
ncbi:MAG: hypothetical protein NT076_00735 [Candidatus Pacearchaeota archaeon]|nr:hypothetical protein [Candidatus Pacearchaeota archaeon]